MKPVNAEAPDLAPIEDLERDIHNLCIGINAATYELLTLIREFDERVGWLKWGLDGCAEWLAWRCDLSMATARCRELRMGAPESMPVAERAFANRFLKLRRDAGRAVMVVNVELPLEAGELIEKALDKARDDVALEHPDIIDTTWAKRQADAFVTLLKEYLSGSDSQNGKCADNYLVNIHVEHSALAGQAGKSSLPIESVKRLCCDSSAVVIGEDGDGQPLSVGRRTRIVPKAIERAVRARDNHRCVFPGCKNRRFLECHHIEHWSNGGDTSVDNLMLLCTKHHTLLHEGGFRLHKDFIDRWIFVRPDGVAVPQVGYRVQDMVDAGRGGTAGEVYDPPRGGLLSVAEKFALEPPPPVYLA